MKTISTFLLLCCLFNLSYCLIGNGFTVWSWGTTRDWNGLAIGMGSPSTTACVLSGVMGDLSHGEEYASSVGMCSTQGRKATAQIQFNSVLLAHGGSCGRPSIGTIYYDNAVGAQATCFWKELSNHGFWVPPGNIAYQNDHFTPIWKIPNLDYKPERVCFLTGLQGVNNTWNDPNTYAGLRKVSSPDLTHPTAGYYVESSLQIVWPDEEAFIYYGCIDFPTNHIITVGTTPFSATTKQTTTITTGTGVKACALTGVRGKFNVNSWDDGIIMNFPATLDGNWSLTVSAGKQASWVCVR
jgi:hypothetical protein